MSSLPGKASEWPSPVLTGDPCGLPLLCAVRGPGKPSQAARRVPADHEIRYPAAQCGEARGLSPRGDVGLPGPALSSLAPPFKGQGSQRPQPHPVVALMTTEPRTVRQGPKSCGLERQAEEPSVCLSVRPPVWECSWALGARHQSTRSPPGLLPRLSRAWGAHSPEQPHGTGLGPGKGETP